MWKSIIYLFVFLFAFGCKPEKKDSNYVEGQQVTSFDGYDMVMKDGERVRFRSNDNSQVYFLFRHAEKNTIDTTGNPNLSKVGVQRAEYIADLFTKTKIDSLYSTMYSRTMFTIDKLAQLQGKKMKPYDPSALGAFAKRLQKALPGTNNVIVGHSNTTPDLVNNLMGKSVVKQIDESDYDNLFIVEINGSNKNLKKLTFKVD